MSCTSAPCTDLEAFCRTCPPVEDVTERLSQLGFHLVFEMEAQQDCRHLLPPLPAQFHYRDAHGTEVVYLAGRDTPMHEGVYEFPSHESRFWLTCGGDGNAFNLAMSALALLFQLRWQAVQEGQDDEDETQQEVA